MKNSFSLLLVSIAIALSSCVKNPVTGKRNFMLLSEKREIAMGQEADPDIVRFFGLYEDKALQAFIRKKGGEMAAVSHRPNLPYEFKVVDSPVVNAFAVPGGYVYFTRGIMAHFNNEAEFAGVLGHEIGHITARHSARQYSKSMLAQVGLVAGMIISPEFAQFAGVAQQGVGLLFLKYGRDAERESDELGVEYSTKIGYDANEMAGFFNTLDRISGQGGEQIPEFLSTHPHPQNRLQDVRQLAAQWRQQVGEAELEVNRNEYLRLIDGLIYGEDPKQGFVENNVFYHPVLEFQFPIPTRWTLQNTPQQVQMAEQEGKALMIFTLSGAQTLQAAAQAVLDNYGLTLVESRQLEVNGLPAIAMVADQQQQGRQSLRTLTYVISYGENIYNIIGATTEADFGTFTSVFTNTMSNFRQLSDPAMLNRQPERVRIKAVRQSGTLEQALRAYQVEENRMEEMAMLNGMQLDDRLEQETLIKVIER